MNSPLNSLRGAAVALAAIVASAGPVVAAPKKAEPAPASRPAPVAPEKKGVFARAKEMIGLKQKAKEQPPEPAPPSASNSKTRKPAAPSPAPKSAVAKAAPAAKATPAKRSAVETKDGAVAESPPAKKRWIKGLFKKQESDKAEEPTLAKAKTARPAPVKEPKPAKPEDAATAAAAPGEKRGVLGFLRRLREPVEDGPAGLAEADKIERPDDWKEHKIVTGEGVALYTFGPNQFNGPDKRLSNGAVVKVKDIKRGYALVTVDGGVTGYMDASLLRDAEKTDFRDPAPPAMASLGTNPDSWAPLAPPPDLPDQPSAMDADAALLLLPPLEPKPNP